MASKSLPQRMSDMLDIPIEGITSRCCVTVNGDEEASACGCNGILSYDTKQVILRTTDGTIRINGESLEICALIDDQITVRGKIVSVHMHETEEGKL